MEGGQVTGWLLAAGSKGKGNDIHPSSVCGTVCPSVIGITRVLN